MLKLSKNIVICTFIKEGSFWIFFQFLLLVIMEHKCFPKLESSLVLEELKYMTTFHPLNVDICFSCVAAFITRVTHYVRALQCSVCSPSHYSVFKDTFCLLKVSNVWGMLQNCKGELHLIRIAPLLILSTEKPSCLLSWPTRQQTQRSQRRPERPYTLQQWRRP